MSSNEKSPSSIVKGGRIKAKNGGELELNAKDPMSAPGGIRSTNNGAAFGPVEIAAHPDSKANIGGLSFREPRGVFGSIFETDSISALSATLGLGYAKTQTGSDSGTTDVGREFDGQASSTDNGDGGSLSVSRRDVLRAGLVTGGVLFSSGSVMAATTTRTRALFNVETNPKGISLRVHPRADYYLPVDERYHAYVEGTKQASFASGDSPEYGHLIPGVSGGVTVGPQGSAGNVLTRLMGDRTRSYELQLDRWPRDAERGDDITITTNRILADVVASAGSSKTTLSIDGDSIPYKDESGNRELGYYNVVDENIVFHVGSEPPTGRSASLTVYANSHTETIDDVTRGVGL